MNNSRRIVLGGLALFTVVAVGAPGAFAATTAEEVAAKNVEARGGKAAWGAVESLRLTGTFQAFSKTKPFTLHRKGSKYHMDHHLGDKPVIVGVRRRDGLVGQRLDGSRSPGDHRYGPRGLRA